MAAVILFGLICIGLYFLHVYFKREEEKNKHYRELSPYIDYKELHSEYARVRMKGVHPEFVSSRYKEPSVDQIKKYFKSHPDKLTEAEKRYKEAEERHYVNREYWKRELIKSRVFAYDYEDVLFQIYAPSASDMGDRWQPQGLSKEYIVKRYAEIKNVSIDDALRTYDMLIRKNVICDLPGMGVFLDSMLWDDYKYKDQRWNVVSDTDMTLTKWMDAHGYKH